MTKIIVLMAWLLWHTSYLLSRRINSPSWWYSSYVGNDNNLLTLYVILVTLSRKTLICSWIWWFKSVGRCHIDIFMHSDFDIIPTYALKYMICGKGGHNSLSLLVCDKRECAYSLSSWDKNQLFFTKCITAWQTQKIIVGYCMIFFRLILIAISTN